MQLFSGEFSDYKGNTLQGLEIYNTAISNMSGVGRTVRGPSMSATPGKVHIIGISEIAGQKVFVLKFLQVKGYRYTIFLILAFK